MANPFGKAKPLRGKPIYKNNHRDNIPSVVNNLIEKTDIILEILDSRFIEKTRNIDIEKKVKKMKKSLIFVLNKSDLVDKNRILREVELSNLKPNVFFSNKDRSGLSQLRRLIKMESRKLGREVVNIGVVGYPNTGKSSLINLLSGKHAARVSSEAGHTRGIQKIKLSEGLYLVDSPGIIPPNEKLSKMDKSKHPSIGAVTWDRTKDPDMVVFSLMREYPGVLEKHYKISEEGNSETIIDELGRKLNYLQKGNHVDEIRTAKQILKDWQSGKIRID